MSYKVTVGNAVLEKCIESVQFNVSTPSDYIFTSRCNNKNLIKVTGNIDTEESCECQVTFYNFRSIIFYT